MTSHHNFQPIVNHGNFVLAIDYIAANTLKLGETVFGKNLPIDTLAIFTHSDKEAVFLNGHIKSLGAVSKLSHGNTLYVEPIGLQVRSYNIRYLGVRLPDATRLEVGYGDFPVNNFDQYSGVEFVKSMKSGNGKAMLEVRHPDFDVRGYIVER